MGCEFCSRVINNKGSLVAHQNRCSSNPNRITTVQIRGPRQGGYNKGRIPWNKGLQNDKRSKCSPESVKKANDTHVANGTKRGKGSTPEKELERIRKITERAKLNNGGYRKGSGRGKKGWYKGIFCDSSWELAFVMYYCDSNIEVERCTEIRTYEYNGTTKNYYPDFIVDGVIYEIKGYETEQSKCKRDCNTDIVLLAKFEMKKYLDYACSKYGKDFTKFYESERSV